MKFVDSEACTETLPWACTCTHHFQNLLLAKVMAQCRCFNEECSTLFISLIKKEYLVEKDLNERTGISDFTSAYNNDHIDSPTKLQFLLRDKESRSDTTRKKKQIILHDANNCDDSEVVFNNGEWSSYTPQQLKRPKTTKLSCTKTNLRTVLDAVDLETPVTVKKLPLRSANNSCCWGVKQLFLE
ncbi:unnamed protein product [Acanthoscelides obtectus]|uniref:Uncharacterized protein n=1 Tax=Acanthoscelides obtectus TaxID=200917 RepID=A0A9P0JSN9_ACAOB|nr:unnamed protein product [Acanthoscelides obtectus]CAK1621860.1 hypothetical protein AOBTE_LOCUS1178 [Acanthoscelides obtectus]